MAKVVFKRTQTNAEIDNIPILDGQLIYSGEGKSYIDYGTNRVPINGTPDSAMSDTSTNPVQNNVIKSYIDTQITTTNNNIHNGTILWQNQDPTSNYAQQTITLSSSDYDCYEILYRQNTSTLRILNTGKIIKGYGTLLMQSIGQNQFRAVNYVNDTSLTIIDNQTVTFNSTIITDNSINIPLYVIGYKTELFE